MSARYMVSDHLTLDDSVAFFHAVFPTTVTKDELEDIKQWFCLRIRNWERHLPKEQP